MRRRNLPVYMEYEFKEALENGGILEIECISSANRTSEEVRGEWWIFVRETLSGQVVRSVLCSRRSTGPRLLKTSRGVVGLAAKLGATLISVPLLEGGIGVCEVNFPETSADEANS